MASNECSYLWDNFIAVGFALESAIWLKKYKELIDKHANIQTQTSTGKHACHARDCIILGCQNENVWCEINWNVEVLVQTC